MRISDWSSDVCSSDLIARRKEGLADVPSCRGAGTRRRRKHVVVRLRRSSRLHFRRRRRRANGADLQRRTARPAAAQHQHSRSEEHTSELQSLMRTSYAVFCLKKKKNNKQSV